MSAAAKAGDPRMGSLMRAGEGGDVTLVGFPFDEGCARNGGRQGAARGPALFRQMAKKMGAVLNPETGVDLSALVVGDAGDACSGDDTLESAHEDMTRRVHSALTAGSLPFCVGGGNDQSYCNASALLAWLSEGHGAAPRDGTPGVGVVNIDAHLDVRPKVGGKAHSGSPFRQLLEDPRYSALNGAFTEFAVQGSQCAAEHAQFVRDRGGVLVWLSELHPAHGAAAESVPARFARELDRLGANVFVSFDIDSIASRDCPGVSCPATVGLSAEEAVAMAFEAGRHPAVRLFDLSELNPGVEDYRTPRLAANMFYAFLQGRAVLAQKRAE